MNTTTTTTTTTNTTPDRMHHSDPIKDDEHARAAAYADECRARLPALLAAKYASTYALDAATEAANHSAKAAAHFPDDSLALQMETYTLRSLLAATNKHRAAVTAYQEEKDAMENAELYAWGE